MKIFADKKEDKELVYSFLSKNQSLKPEVAIVVDAISQIDSVKIAVPGSKVPTFMDTINAIMARKKNLPPIKDALKTIHAEKVSAGKFLILFMSAPEVLFGSDIVLSNAFRLETFNVENKGKKFQQQSISDVSAVIRSVNGIEVREWISIFDFIYPATAQA